jgi:hypothetical protein
VTDGTDLEAALDELFATPPDGFTAARNALAKALRAEKRTAEADEVTTLRKPGRLVWALNQLGLEDDASLATMFAAADALRDGEADDVRTAVADLREAVNGAAAAAAAHLEPPRPSDRADLAQDLLAIVADEGALAALADGRLLAVPPPNAFGITAAPTPRRSGSGAGKASKKRATKAKARATASSTAKPAQRPPDQLAIRRARKRHQEAAKAADAADRALARARKALEVDAEALEAADEELTDATGALEEAEGVLELARAAKAEAERVSAAAIDAQERSARELAEAKARAEEAEAELAEAAEALDALDADGARAP